MRRAGRPAIGDLVKIVVHVELADASAPGLAFVGRGRHLGGAAQQCADARHQLARRERLADIVVGAELEADDTVRLPASRRQYDGWDVWVWKRRAQHVEPAAVRKRDIENQQIDGSALERAPRFLDPTAVSTLRPSRSR